jgi:hypothetical protein
MLTMLDWYTLLVWDDGTVNVYDMHPGPKAPLCVCSHARAVEWVDLRLA